MLYEKYQMFQNFIYSEYICSFLREKQKSCYNILETKPQKISHDKIQ